MKIAFNPSTVAALTAPPNNKDITFDLRGRNIFARGVKFYGTDTNTWRPVVDNLTSNSTTSSLSANQGRVLKTLIDGKSDSGHNHDGRYVKKTGDTMSGALNFANGTWNKVGDDSYVGDCNISGHFGIKAANTTYPGITFFDNSSARLGSLTAYSGNIKYGAYSLQFLDNGSTRVNASTWANPFSAYDKDAVKDGQAVCVWGQGSYLSNLSSDSGNIALYLKRINANAATLNMILDGEYYAHGNQRLAHISEIPSSLKNPHALTISLNGTSQGPYDGSVAKNINITPGSIGAATSGHNHDGRYVYNYGGIQMDGVSVDKNALGMTTNSGITGDWWHILQAAWNGEYRWNSQIAFPTQNRNGMYYRSGLDDNTAWGSWVKLLDTNNYPSILDSRYYTESEVNNLLSTKLDRVKLTTGSWNPRGYNLAADYHYNGGDLSISESKGQIHVSIDGYFWQNEGQYRVLDTSDVAGLKGNLTVHQYLSNTDTTWWPLIWGGSSHANTSDSTGAVYKSHDVLSWQTSSQTLYATRLRTTFIDLENNRGISRVTSGGTSPFKGIQLPDLQSNGVGIFSKVGEGNGADEGGVIISADTSVIYNSFDTGWGLTIRDKDKGQMNISGSNTIAFGVRQDYRAYSLGGFEKAGSSNSYVLLGGGDHKLESALSVANADMVDGYHASGLWRSDGGTWNPNANISLTASGNNQEWSFDIYRNGHTGCYWHVWDNALGTLLKVNADNGKVYAPYNFVGNLEGNANTANNANSATNADTVDGWHKDEINRTLYITSGAPGLSSYWAKLWEINLNNQYNDVTITFLAAASYYPSYFAIFSVYLRQNGSGTSKNINARLVELIGNIAVGDTELRLYVNNTTGNCQLWGNVKNQYGTMNLSVLKKAWRTNTDSSNIGTFFSTSFSSVQSLPGDGWYKVGVIQQGVVGAFNPSSHTHTWTSITDKIVAGNEFNVVNAGYNSTFWFNYLPINDRNNKATISTYCMGNGQQGYASVTASGFIKNGGNQEQLLRADGGIAAFNWSGQSGQPTWLWGGNNFNSYYVYNPSNFRVAYASSAGNADTVDGYHVNGGNVAPYGHIPSIESDGVMEVGKYIDFHNDNNGKHDFSTRLQTTGNYGNVVNLPSASGTLALTSQASSFDVNTAQYLRSLGNRNCQTGRTQAYGDVYSYNTYSNNTGSPTEYTSVIGFGRGTGGTVEIAGGWCDTNLYWRSLRNCCEDWYSWRTVLDSNNYTDFIGSYYWANVKISTTSSTTTSPTVSNLTATSSIRMSNILLEHTNEINNTTNDGSLNLNCRNSGNVSLCAGGGKVGIGTRYPSHELYVMGYTHTKGFGINPYYLSDSGLLPTISPGDGYTYRCLEIGRPTKISCIIADKTYLPGSTRGVLLNFKEGFDGQLVLLKDLQNYGSGNGYFWVMPSGCKIIKADGSSILIGQNQISNIYDDGHSRFFIYSSKYSVWIEFLCS